MKKRSIYKSFETCTIAEYIECAFNNNLKAIHVVGKYKENDAINAWNSIHLRYADAVGGAAIESFKSKMRAEMELTMRINAASICHTVLSYKRCEESIKTLHLLGYSLQFTPDSFAKDLQVLNNKIISGLSQLNTLRDELKKIQDDVKPMDVNIFVSYKMIISKFVGYPINDNIKLIDFVALCRMYEAEQERLRLQQQSKLVNK